MINIKYFYIISCIILCCLLCGCIEEDEFDFYGADGHKIILHENENAVNVTYNEVIEFVLMDDTDKIIYNEETFMCGDYAERLHTNAEASKIKCGYVILYFTHDNFIHACNAFMTLDRGLIFIDCSSGDTIVDFLNDPCLIYNPKPVEGSIKEYGIVLYLPLGKVRDYKIYW